MFSNQNERLVNYCLLESVTGKLIDERTAILVSQRLKQEGYFGGLTSPLVRTHVFPTLSHSSNINGGNPDKSLILGELEFEGDPNLVAKEGAVVGANFSSTYRATYKEGQYLNASLLVGVSFSPEHSMNYTTLNWSACSRNKLRPASYLDFCVNASNLNRKLSIDRTESVSLSLGHLKYRSKFGFSDLGYGLKRSFYEGYEQNQAHISLDTIHEKQWYSSVRVRLGEAVADKLALNYGLDASATRMIGGRLITVSLGREFSNGGKLLGVNRADRTTRVQVSVPLTEKVSAKVGYAKTDSSIDYFDERGLSSNLTLVW
ncbi:hypothetical protein N8146_08810 [Ascidiaceihabitans sp.]|nr:hypothetical protein [Ascidiaceihabitans sp.]